MRIEKAFFEPLLSYGNFEVGVFASEASIRGRVNR
jgi:hypothetical protein